MYKSHKSKSGRVNPSIPRANLIPTVQRLPSETNELNAENVLTILSNEALLIKSNITKLELKLIMSEFDGGKLPSWWNSQITNKFKLLEKSSVQDLFNYIVFRYQFYKYPITGKVFKFPLYVLIEPVSSCNLRCPMCFQVDKSFTKKPYMGIMDFGLFTRVIDECAENGTRAITLASRGEPTLHPRLPEMLSYLKGKFFEVKLNTNGTHLSEKLCRSIFENNIDILVLSIDSEIPDIFESIRYGADYKKVLNNIVVLNKIKDEEYPEVNTIIRVSGIKIREDQNPESFKLFWSQYANEVTMGGAEERWDTYNNHIHPHITGRCAYPLERFYIWYDGTCNPCDVDYKSLLSPGNLDGKTISEIWHSEKLNQLRSDHISGNRSNHNPCDRCQVQAC